MFDNIFRRKRKIIMARLNGVQNSPRYGYSDFHDYLERVTRSVNHHFVLRRVFLVLKIS